MPSTYFTSTQLELLETFLDEFRNATPEQKTEIDKEACNALIKQERKNGNKLSDGKLEELQKVFLSH
jgi:hypothetical protein